jgi:hypothetical protein
VQLEDRVHEHLRAGRAAGQVDVDRHDVVDAHPTVASVALVRRSDIALVPITGLPALPRGLIWCTAHENTRVRNLANLAALAAHL